MQLVYDSFTGNTKKMAHSFSDYPLFSITETPLPHEPIFLFTHTIRFGEIPERTKTFLEQYGERVVGVAVSGNRNWGALYGKAGDHIQERYDIPLICKFELQGTKSDKERIGEYLENYGK